MTIAKIIELLTAQFEPIYLEVKDISSQHAGHAAYRPGEVTHVSIIIASAIFIKLSRTERARMVHTTLQPCFDAGLHALTLQLSAPAEFTLPAKLSEGPQD